MSMSTYPSYYSQPDPFYGQTVVEITVPSGALIVSDDLRRTPTFDIDPQQSINYGAGCDAYSKLLAERANVAYASVGNTCPRVTVNSDGLIRVVSLDWTQETGPIFEDSEVAVGTICTTVWAAMATDYQHWLDNGGQPIDEANAEFKFDTYFLVDVVPGKYRWTVFSHSDSFDSDEPGRIVYGQLELIEAY